MAATKPSLKYDVRLAERDPWGDQANVFIITNITGDYNKIQLDRKPLTL